MDVAQAWDKLKEWTSEVTESVKAGARAVGQKATDLHDTFVGAEIARTVESYSAVYGEILLGVHRDLEMAKADLKQAKADIEDAHRKIRFQNGLLYLSFLMSFVAVVVAGYVLWMRG